MGLVRSDVLTVEHLVDEPFYQLVRQQLLAHALETAGAEGASRVRVMHVLAPANLAYQASLARPEHRALGAAVTEVWAQLLRTPDRFVSVDSAMLLDPVITSHEYAARYGAPLLRSLQDLADAYGTSVDGVQDAVDFDGDLMVHADDLALHLAGTGTGLTYPFTRDELDALVGELEAEVG